MTIYVTTDNGKELSFDLYENTSYDGIRERIAKDEPDVVYAWFSLESHVKPDFESGDVPEPDYIREGEVW